MAMFGCIVSGRLVNNKFHLNLIYCIHKTMVFCITVFSYVFFYYFCPQVQTDFQQVGESQFLINIPEADSINHIVIFLTGTMALPTGMAGSVYFSWPDPSAPPSWILLGYISNTKPSAIFKISQLKKQEDTSDCNNLINSQPSIFGSQPISHIAQIGIDIGPDNQITPVVVSKLL